MKRFIYILLFMSASLSGQEVVMLDKEGADALRGSYGRYSAIDPVATPDGMYMIPKRCLSDSALKDAHDLIVLYEKSENIVEYLPELGEECVGGRLYINTTPRTDELSNLLKCVQTHNRTEHDPKTIPALFTFFRENSDTLTWIQNEYVYPDWKRVWEDITYTVIQEHMTVVLQTPDLVPALWVADVAPCSDWVQPTGAQDAYNIGDCVTFNGNTYESLINANVWSPTVYPAGWQQL